MDETEYAGKIALVTGGTRGIGRAVVKALASKGNKVAFTFRSSVEEAETLRAELTESGADILALQGDASVFDDASSAVSHVLKIWGRIDVLVNNAGVTKDNLMLRMSENDWDFVINTNLKSLFNFSKAVYRPMMKQRSGKIINISSVVGITGNAGQTNYAASKAGVIGFSKSLAKELGGRNITVNVVAPGFIETDMTAKLGDSARDAMLSTIPLKRPGTPEMVADAVCFLSSSAADYITGHVLQVDGGLAI